MSASPKRESIEAGPSPTLARTPLAHLVIYAWQKHLSGVLLLDAETETVSVRFSDGRVVGAQTSAPVAYLGHVLYEQGAIDTETLNRTLAELAAHGKGGTRHGELLLRRGAIDEAQLTGALVQQAERKVIHAFGLPETARYSFAPGEPSSSLVSLDPRALVVRGLRAHGDVDVARGVLARLGEGALEIEPGVDLDRYGFGPEERAVAESFSGGAIVGPERSAILVAYVLAITKALRPKAPEAAAVSQRVPRHPTPAPTSSRRPPQVARLAPPTRMSADAKVNFQNAEIAYAQRELELAEAYCLRAHEEEPLHAEYLAFLAWLIAARTEGDLRDPLQKLDRALDLHPGCERAYMYRAQLRRRRGDEAGALSDFRTAFTLNPSNVEAAREVRIHDMRARREGEQRSSSNVFRKILKR